MLARRFAQLVPSAMVATSMRGLKSHDPTYEDERWLEAELDEATKHKTPEERYAAEQQKRVLAKMMAKMRDEHKEHVEVKVKETKDKHAEEVNELKAQLKAIQDKLNKVAK